LVAGLAFAKDESVDDSAYDSKDEEPVQRTTPEIEFTIKSERKIANARLCDVLRKLFGSNRFGQSHLKLTVDALVSMPSARNT
jgi:hypothetical protein